MIVARKNWLFPPFFELFQSLKGFGNDCRGGHLKDLLYAVFKVRLRGLFRS